MRPSNVVADGLQVTQTMVRAHRAIMVSAAGCVTATALWSTPVASAHTAPSASWYLRKSDTLPCAWYNVTAMHAMRASAGRGPSHRDEPRGERVRLRSASQFLHQLNVSIRPRCSGRPRELTSQEHVQPLLDTGTREVKTRDLRHQANQRLGKRRVPEAGRHRWRELSPSSKCCVPSDRQ